MKVPAIAGVCFALAATFCARAAEVEQPATKPRRLSLENKPWKGDFDEMLALRRVRVLVPYSRTLYFNDKGRERGVVADLVRDFERHLNQKYAKALGKRPLTVFVIPTTRDKLLSGVTGGSGDIAAANLTVTEERLKIVDFIAPTDRTPVRELVVTGPKSPRLGTVEDLSGKTVHVRPASSYHESVVALNGRLRKAGKAPVKIVPLPDELEDEDILEMLNAGLFEFAVVDDWKARMWAQVLSKIKVREDLALRAAGFTGWAIRKGSPLLAATAQDFYQTVVKKQGGIDARLAQYHKRVKQITNNIAAAEYQRFQGTLKLFEQWQAVSTSIMQPTSWCWMRSRRRSRRARACRAGNDQTIDWRHDEEGIVVHIVHDGPDFHPDPGADQARIIGYGNPQTENQG